MPTRGQDTITEIMEAARAGDTRAREHLWQTVYDELRRVAHNQLRGEAHGPTALQTTVLVHEAYLRLVGRDGDWASRRQFFACAARAMRCIRVDDARRRKTLKRRGERGQSLPADIAAPDDWDPTMLLAIDEALSRLEAIDPRRAELVQLRYFAGLTFAQIAEIMGLSARKVELEWHFTRVWLHRELSKGDTRV